MADETGAEFSVPEGEPGADAPGAESGKERSSLPKSEGDGPKNEAENQTKAAPEPGRASVPGGKADGGKKRRGSMFQEAANVKDIIPATRDETDVSTLQNFLKEAGGLGGNEGKQGNKKNQMRRPKLIFENTYRLESKKPFVTSQVEVLVGATLEEMLRDLRYCSKTATAECSKVAEMIRNRVVSLEYDRYKIIVHVALGSMSRQGFCIAFKHVGDSNRDAYVQASFTNRHIFAAASVHAIYYE